jgi:hypothetical protein
VNIDHFVVTRINMAMYSSTPKSFLASKEAKDVWMNGKIPLIKKHHIGSLKYQTNKDFKLIWIVDERTPKEFTQILEEMSKEINATIIFDLWPLSVTGIREGNCLSGNWLEKFKPMIKKENVAITRLDSDDILSRDFIEVVKSHFEKPPVCIDFWTRITKDDYGGLTLVQSIPKGKPGWCSPTVTCIEKMSDFKSPFICSHFKLSSVFPVKVYDDLVWCKTEKGPPNIISRYKETRLEDIKGFEGLGF